MPLCWYIDQCPFAEECSKAAWDRSRRCANYESGEPEAGPPPPKRQRQQQHQQPGLQQQLHQQQQQLVQQQQQLSQQLQMVTSSSSSSAGADDVVKVRRGVLKHISDSLDRAVAAASHAVKISAAARSAFEEEHARLTDCQRDINKLFSNI
jgi:small-conductance mechanosensitive channel